MVVPTVLYGTETWNMRKADRIRLDVFEMRCLRIMVGATRLDRVRNEEARGRMGMERKLLERVDQRVLSWYGHVVRMDEKCLTERVWKAEVRGMNLGGRCKRG